MPPQYSIDNEGLQASAAVAEVLSRRLTTFVQPLLAGLDALLDLRLVQTFLATLHVLLEFRHRNNGLLLSELGAYLASPDHAPAGTKRLSNLLHSGKWASQFIEAFLWRQADERLAELEQAGEDGLLMWDESVVEKSESIAEDRTVRRSFQQSSALKADQTGVLQSAGRSSHLCPRNETFSRCSCWVGKDPPPWLRCAGGRRGVPWRKRAVMRETGILDACARA